MKKELFLLKGADTVNEIKSKLTSRKFWVTLISLVAGIAQLFGADGELIELISGTALSLFPAVAYVITEGRIDLQKRKESNKNQIPPQ